MVLLCTALWEPPLSLVSRPSSPGLPTTKIHTSVQWLRYGLHICRSRHGIWQNRFLFGHMASCMMHARNSIFSSPEAQSCLHINETMPSKRRLATAEIRGSMWHWREIQIRFFLRASTSAPSRAAHQSFAHEWWKTNVVIHCPLDACKHAPSNPLVQSLLAHENSGWTRRDGSNSLLLRDCVITQGPNDVKVVYRLGLACIGVRLKGRIILQSRVKVKNNLMVKVGVGYRQRSSYSECRIKRRAVNTKIRVDAVSLTGKVKLL
jgi:hypothetical protein